MNEDSIRLLLRALTDEQVFVMTAMLEALSSYTPDAAPRVLNEAFCTLPFDERTSLLDTIARLADAE